MLRSSTESMRVTVFGASGLLGQALMREWNEDDVAGLDSSDADIRDPVQAENVMRRTKPDWVVLSAAYTDVDGCESNRDLAFAVNRDGAANVASAAKKIGAQVAFLSSDYVFDGRKTIAYETGDPRNPQSVYGKTKAEAELKLLNIDPDVCIIRTSWLFGAGGKCFPDTILKLASSRPSLKVVNDQRGCPTYTEDLARTIIQLCRKNARGIFHATNTGDCTWFEFAREIIRNAGLATKVEPATSQEMARPAPRPAYSVLSLSRLSSVGVEMPSWRDALVRYMKARAAIARV